MHDINPDDLHIEMELGSREAIKGAVQAGLGVAILSAATVMKEVKLGGLVAIPLDPPLRRPLSLVFSPDKFRSKLLDAFISFVEERFRMNGLTLGFSFFGEVETWLGSQS